MALNIQGNLETKNGLTLTNSYARVVPQLEKNGTSIYVNTEYFPTEEAYSNGAYPLPVNFKLIDCQFDYDRNVDGSDILMVATNKMKERLENFGFSVSITEL